MARRGLYSAGLGTVWGSALASLIPRWSSTRVMEPCPAVKIVNPARSVVAAAV